MSRDAARTDILFALHQGLSDAPPEAVAVPDKPASIPVGPDAWERLNAFYESLGVRLRLAKTPAEAATLVAETAREHKAASYVRWNDLPDGLAAACDAALAGLERLDAAKRADLARADMGITGAQAAFLDSGSIALSAAVDRQRAASLLPPMHVCLLPRRVLLPDISALPELLRGCRDAKGLPSCLNLVTGPSSTADIELMLVRGVHGPGVLEVIGLDWE